jgi:hypothetical protein
LGRPRTKWRDQVRGDSHNKEESMITDTITEERMREKEKGKNGGDIEM